MNSIHSKVDMNLYRLLLYIYQHRSISVAAEHLHITQSAVSHSLGKLRTIFNDPLFERDGRKMKPTPAMVAMYPTILKSVQSLHDLPGGNTEFSLTEHQRHIRLGLRDLLEIPLLPKLSAMLLASNPHLTLRSEQFSLNNLDAHFGANEIDILVDAMTPTREKIHTEYLFEEPFAIVVRDQHPYIDSPTLKQYLSYQHLLVSLKKSDLNLVDMALAKHQTRRKIAIYCEHYIAGIQTILTTDLIMTMPKSFANELKNHYAIRVLEPPLDLPSIPVCMYWHERTHNDPVFVWFRKELKQLLLAQFQPPNPDRKP